MGWYDSPTKLCLLKPEPYVPYDTIFFIVSEHVAGIEPAAPAWKAGILPLYDTCIDPNLIDAFVWVTYPTQCKFSHLLSTSWT